MSKQPLLVQRPKWNDSCYPFICGIANAGGGSLVIPTNAKDYTSGMRKLHRLLEKIPSQTVRALGESYFAEPVMEDEKLCLEVSVPAAEEPLRYQGTYYYYSDGSNKELSEAKIKELFSQSTQQSWESRVQPTVSEEDLAFDLLLDLEENIEGSEFSASSEPRESLSDLLINLGLKDERLGLYTNAGVVLLCTNPERYIPGTSVRIGLFGSGAHDLRFQDEITGPLPEQLEQTLNLLLEKYFPSVIADETPAVIFPPQDALKEAIFNALLHRDYETSAPVRISVYSNRVSINNTGSIPEAWTVEELTSEHGSRPHNPVMARALRKFRLFNGVGGGIARIKYLISEASLPEPIFEARADETTVTFFFGEAAPDRIQKTTSNSLSSDKVVKNRDLTDFEKQSVAAAHNLDMTLTDEYILKIFRKNGRATAVKIAQILGISESTVRRSFKRLISLGFIERVGSNKTGYWKVLK